MLEIVFPFSLLLALLGVLFFLRKRRQGATEVASLELWHNLADSPAIGWYQWQRAGRWLALFIFMLLVFSSSLPRWRSFQKDFSIILDCSASMQTIEGGKTRFVKAKEELRELLRSLKKNRRVKLYVYPQIKRYEGSAGEILQILPRLQATFQEGRVAVVAHRVSSQTLWLSDGSENSASHWPKLRLWSIGQPTSNNVGIVHFQARASYEASQVNLFVVLENASATPKKVQLQILSSRPRQVLLSEQIFLSSGKTPWQKQLSLPFSHLQVKIVTPDNFKLDNTLWALKQEPLRIWLDSLSQPVLQQAFLSSPGVEVVKEFAQAQLVVMGQKYHPSKAQQQAIYYNGVAPPSLSPMTRKSPAKWLFTSSPLFRSVKLEKLLSPEIFPVASWPTEAQELVVTPEQQAILLSHPDYLYLGWDIQNSAWPESASFAIFWSNYLQKIAPHRGSFLSHKASTVFPSLGFSASSQAVSLLSSRETNNRGKKISPQLTREELPSLFSQTISLTPLCSVIILLLTLFMWWREKNTT